MPSVNSSSCMKGFPMPGPQQPSGNEVMNQVFFASERGWSDGTEGTEFDLVIIGSGFCGYAVAERALKNDPDCRILLLERGQYLLPSHVQSLPPPFVQTAGSIIETFPWTLSARTASGKGGPITWQHGMVPFFGGRSTLWSAWSITPTDEEMFGWPSETREAVMKNISAAKELLYVQPTNEMNLPGSTNPSENPGLHQPVFDKLQNSIQCSLRMTEEIVPGIYRVEAAPLASASGRMSGIDFEKFSIVGEMLELLQRSNGSKTKKSGNQFKIVTECIVEKILHEGGRAIALQTSRGILPLANANLVLAMGTLPPTTLVANSFPNLREQVGQRFSAHFITSIIAKIPLSHLRGRHESFSSLELGACYIAGIANDSYGQQFHIQLSAMWDEDPEKNEKRALRYMPDVMASATMEQRLLSKGCVVFVCAVLGELEAENEDNWFIQNNNDPDLTTNSLLQVVASPIDLATWDFMDDVAFQILENVLCTDPSHVEYWHKNLTTPGFMPARPTPEERRIDVLVHESSTMHIGSGSEALVDTDYKLQGTHNVYVTGGSLWPRGGSWNPTLAMVALSQDLANKLVPT